MTDKQDVAMTEMQRQKIRWAFHEKMIWTRFGTLFLGLWLLTSPATFGYADEPARYSDWISGFLLIVFGLISIRPHFAAWIYGGVLVGIWLQFAPLLFWAESVIYVNYTLIGVLAIAFSLLIPLRPPVFEVGPQIPPGWTYNPSSWQQRTPIIILAVFSWFIARYLASYQLHYIDVLWDPFFGLGSQKVITSLISQQVPISDAGIGAVAFSLEAILGAKGGARRWHTRPWVVVIFGILAVSLGMNSIILVILQPTAISAWCGLCLIIHFCMMLMIALTIDEVVATCQFLRRSYKEGKPFWPTFFMGSDYQKDSIDARTPSFHDSLGKIFRGMFWGITPPWNLVITALIGVWLLFISPLFGFQAHIAANHYICGALLLLFSIISWAEVTRAVRLINCLIGLWLAISPWILAGRTMTFILHSELIALAIIIFSLFKGKIKEKYGTWHPRIF